MSPSSGWAPGRSVLQGMRYSKCFSLSSLSFNLLLPTEEKLMMVQPHQQSSEQKRRQPAKGQRSVKNKREGGLPILER